MFCAVLLYVCIYVVLAASDEELVKKCRSFHEDVTRCCSKLPYKSPEKSRTIDKTDLSECFKHHTSSSSLYELDECVAKKLGFYGADGKLDMEVITSFFETEYGQNQELFGAIKENCFNADILNEKSPDISDFTKIDICIIKQLVKNCFEWSNEGSCNESEIKKTAEVCKDID